MFKKKTSKKKQDGCTIDLIHDYVELPRVQDILWHLIKGEVSPNNNVDWVSRKQFYKPNSKSLSRFG